jgi:hypothetical protein
MNLFLKNDIVFDAENRISFKWNRWNNTNTVMHLDKSMFSLSKNMEDEKTILVYLKQSAYFAIFKYLFYDLKNDCLYKRFTKHIETQLKEFCNTTKWVHPKIDHPTDPLYLLCGPSLLMDEIPHTINSLSILISTDNKDEFDVKIAFYVESKIIQEKPYKIKCHKCTKKAKQIHALHCNICQFLSLYKPDYEKPCTLKPKIRRYHYEFRNPRITLYWNNRLFEIKYKE